MMNKHEPISLFISYAHEDESLRKQLETHLSLLQRQGLVSTWQDRQITAGTDWAQAIDEHLKSASIILLLISADFLASDYCYGIEMQCALDRDKAKQARVIPIALRPCDWKGVPFAHLQALPTDACPITRWPDRDEAWTNVAAGIRQVIKELPALSVKTPSAALPPVWNIPYPQNPLFTGREELLTQLATTLHAGQPTALSQPQAISGLGGIGKTQLALEYAYRYRQDYQAVLWAQADTRENLTSSYLTIAALLNLPEKSEQESARVIAAVKVWLQRNTNWLLILDNADDLALAHDFLPPSMGGHVLLTTRAQATGRFARRLEVDILSTELGALFLLRRAGLLPADAILEQASEHDRSIARAICEELGGLPLALDQAGAYVEETGCSLSEYQHLYQRRRADLLAERRGQLVDDHPLPVATTWSLSFAQVEQKNPAAADLLRLCAFLAPDAIPEEMITQGAEHLGPLLAAVGADSYLLNQAIEALRSYSLLRREASSGIAPSLSVHRLMQAVLQEHIPEHERVQWTYRIISALDRVFPGNEYAKWSMCERLVPHILNIEEHTHAWENAPLELASLLHRTAYYLSLRARYKQAEPLYQRVLSIWEQTRGSDHSDVTHVLEELARLYDEQGKYEQAELLHRRVLSIREQALGPDHPDVAYALDRLAYISSKQGRDEQAELLYQRALHILERQEPDSILRPLINLGAHYGSQGKNELAQACYQQALHIWEKKPPRADYLTGVIILTNLSGTYCEQGEYEQAELLSQRALHICEQATGPNHPDMILSLDSLAYAYQMRRQYEQAESLYQRALHICEQALEEEHHWVTSTLINLAALYSDQGKYSQAEPLFQRALSIREQQLGALHPDTALSVWGLAVLSEQQQQYEQATSFYQRALSIYKHALGSQHPITQGIRTNYAHLLHTMGRDAEAAALDQP